MDISDTFRRDFSAATKLHAEGDFTAAENRYEQLLAAGENRETVLRSLLQLYLQSQQADRAIEVLKTLIDEVPDSFFYYSRLAALMEGFGKLRLAIDYYQQFLQRQPDNAEAYYNIALLYKKGKRYREAEQAYEKAIGLGISASEEVYSNMGVLYTEMRQAGKARQMYEQALEISPAYISAKFNLAGLHEEQGLREQACILYQQILESDPRHLESLSRLAYANTASTKDRSLLKLLQLASEGPTDNLLGKEAVYFALGKIYDDLEQYNEAYTAYTEANKLGKLRNKPYRHDEVEAGFNELMAHFSAERISQVRCDRQNSPVFICGMFRSGSTLLEQILSAHAAITAGGELDYLQWLVMQTQAPYPQRTANAPVNELQALANEYLTLVGNVFPEAALLTDKQPDNFLYLGLIKMLFPDVKIIYTSRSLFDNCLSVYFQQLGGNLNYATSLDDTAHYYRQHEKLMAHWHDCFADNIFTLSYDELVHSPEPVIRRTLDFLGLDWDDNCLAFEKQDNLVKTASVWQVRDKLHTNSSGRWQNYAAFVEHLRHQ